MLPPSLYTIKGIMILNNDGNRILAKYYDDHFSTVKEQKEFEKSVFTKTNKIDGQIIMIDSLTVVYRSNVDLYFYVIASSQENEIMLTSVLNCLFDSISLILRKNVEKRYLLDNLDAVMLAVDEICDNGIMLEIDPSQIAQRVFIKQDETTPFSEQTVVDVLRSILK